MDFEIIEREARDAVISRQKVEWEKKRKSEALNDLMSLWDGFFLFLMGFLSLSCFLGGMGVLYREIFCISHWGNQVWTAVLMLLSCGFFGVTWPLFIAVEKNEHPFFMPESELLPTLIIPAFFTPRIKQIKEELLGEESEFHRVNAEVTSVNAEARSLVEQLNYRLLVSDAAYLIEARNSAQEDAVASQVTLEKLAVFKGKIDASLVECCDAVQQLQQPLSDLQLVRRVVALRARRTECEREVQSVLSSSISLLQRKMTDLRHDVIDRFEGCGVQLALSAHNSGNLAEDLRRIEQTIDSFVPARVLEARPVEVTIDA